MHNRDGEFIIQKIVDWIDLNNEMPTDSEIVYTLRKMDKHQISQLVNMGDVCDWRNEIINSELED